ncbi:hypothetical protein IMZ48_11645 [Candidatus Bathyarchaeota archaeon]|nr:hypothetical protein [Candidatus Bathyarchaeota archaeon]
MTLEYRFQLSIDAANANDDNNLIDRGYKKKRAAAYEFERARKEKYDL